MKKQSFEEVARSLLVYLKSQIPALSAKTNRCELERQIQSITFTIRTSLIQLEATADNGQTDVLSLQNDLKELKTTNAKLEESLFLEMDKTQLLNEKISKLNEFLSNNQFTSETKQKLESQLQSKQQLIEKLESQIEEKNKQLENVKMKPAPDEQALQAMKKEIDNLERKLITSYEDINELNKELKSQRQKFDQENQNLKLVIENCKQESEKLRAKLNQVSHLDEKNSELLSEIEALKNEIKQMPSKELIENAKASANAKVQNLEQLLENTQIQLDSALKAKKEDKTGMLIKEKQVLQARNIELENRLLSIQKEKIQQEKDSKNSFVFSAEDCVYFFETFSQIANRLKTSPENRDIFEKTSESIKILQKTKAIRKILTVANVFDKSIHKAIKSFRNDFLDDGTIIYEESPGFAANERVIQKALVWVAKSSFICTECKSKSRKHEFFCTKCGLELTAPDGSSKRDLQQHPTSVEINLSLLDELIKQNNYDAANELLKYLESYTPDNSELIKRQNILIRAQKELASFGAQVG